MSTSQRVSRGFHRLAHGQGYQCFVGALEFGESAPCYAKTILPFDPNKQTWDFFLLQSIQNIVTYVVVISTENPDEVLLPGMTANLQVVVAKRVGVLQVPNMALRFRPPGQPEDVRAEPRPISATEPGGAGRVFVLDGKGHPKPMALRLGITNGRATEVLPGDLKEGQLVIIGTAVPESAPEATSSLLNLRLR